MILDVNNGKIVNGLDEFCIQFNDPYMEMMVKALAKVSSEYMFYDDLKHTENTYVSELYYQWRQLLDNNNPNGLILNIEPNKYLNRSGLKKRVEPDVILHGSQSNCQDNRIACEVKRQGWCEERLIKDMDTLHDLLTSAEIGTVFHQNFKWAVFLQIGGTIERLKDYIKQNSFNDNIWCIVVDDSVTQITIKRIREFKNDRI